MATKPTVAATARGNRTVRYPPKLQVAAWAVLAFGWLMLAIPRFLTHLPTFSSSPALDGVAIAVAILAASGLGGFLLVRWIPGKASERETHIEAALLPALAFGCIMVLIIAPIMEIIVHSIAAPAPAALKESRGIIGALWGIYISTLLTFPLQFLLRDISVDKRLMALALLVAAPIAWTLSAGPILRTQWMIVFASWWVLCIIALALIETLRHMLEASGDLLPKLLSENYRSASDSYKPQPHVRRIGVALSGGGYRASLFGLGAMMYVHDACAMQSGQLRRISALTSVSGGSITNGLLAHCVKLGTGAGADIDAGARVLIGHIVKSGSMFSGSATPYYLLLLPLTAFLTTLLIWTGLRNITLTIAWHMVVIPAGLAALFVGLPWIAAKAPRIRFEWLDGIKEMVMIVGFVAVAAGMLHWVLSREPWRLALGWLGALVLSGLIIAFVWQLRGRLIQMNFDRLLRRVTSSPRLSSAHAGSHHVFCATEVQFGETVFFSQDAIRSRSFNTMGTGRLPTAIAIRASAAFPGGFPPLVLSGVKGSQHADIGARARGGWYSTSHMVLVDGGVRDNLGVTWFDIAPDLDERIIVSAATNRHVSRIITKVVGVNEALSLLNLINIPYNTRERLQRRALNTQLLSPPWTATNQATAGNVVHIEDSPYDLTNRIKAKASGAQAAGAWLDRSRFLPDWEIDQLLAAEKLWDATGTHRGVLQARADAVRAHLETLEDSLPEPPRLTDRELIALKAASMSAPLGGTRSSGSDAEAAWSMRAQVSALIGTKLSRIASAEAMNLIVHGYYLTMANLHLCSNWPLTDKLDGKRLEALFAGLPPAKHADAAARGLLADAQKLCSNKLQGSYYVVSFFSVRMPVRLAGSFVSKRAIVALGIDLRGRMEPLGAWIAPSAHALDPQPRFDPFQIDGEMKRLRTQFWSDVTADLRQRGLRNVIVCCRELPVPRIMADEDFDQCDGALRSAYSHVSLQPRSHALLEQSFASLFASTDEKMSAALKQVLLSADESTARRQLDDFAAQYGEKEPQLRETWQKMWPEISAYIRLAPASRELLEQIDAFVAATQKSLKDRAGTRGYISEELALAEICRDLQRMLRDWKNAGAWKKRLRVLQPALR